MTATTAAPIAVRRVTINGAPAVEIDLADHVDLLRDLARAVLHYGLTAAAARIASSPISEVGHAAALCSLQRHPAIRGAMRLRLSVGSAEELADALDLAVLGGGS